MKNRHRGQGISSSRGFLIITVTVALMVVGLLALSMIKVGGGVAREISTAASREKARMMAEAGLAHAIRNIRSPGKSTPANICNTSYALGNVFVSHTYKSGFSYNVKLDFSTSFDEPNELKVISEGRADGVAVTLERGFSRLKYEYSASQDCDTSKSYLCTLYPIRDNYACILGSCDPDPNDSWLYTNYAWYGESIRSAIDFGFESERSNFSSTKKILLARVGLYARDYWGGTSGSLRVYSLDSSWGESSLDWGDTGNYESSPYATWNFREGRGMRWVDVTSLANRWVTATYYGVVLRPRSGIGMLYFYSKDETTSTESNRRTDRPRFDLRPRLEVFYIPKGSC